LHLPNTYDSINKLQTQICYLEVTPDIAKISHRQMQTDFEKT